MGLVRRIEARYSSWKQFYLHVVALAKEEEMFNLLLRSTLVNSGKATTGKFSLRVKQATKINDTNVRQRSFKQKRLGKRVEAKRKAKVSTNFGTKAHQFKELQGQ